MVKWVYNVVKQWYYTFTIIYQNKIYTVLLSTSNNDKIQKNAKIFFLVFLLVKFKSKK